LTAAMTLKGFCDVAALSKYTNDFPLIFRWKIGKSFFISATLSI